MTFLPAPITKRTIVIIYKNARRIFLLAFSSVGDFPFTTLLDEFYCFQPILHSLVHALVHCGPSQTLHLKEIRDRAVNTVLSAKMLYNCIYLCDQCYDTRVFS